MAKAERDFNAGYILACAAIVHLHDEPVVAADVMAELGVSWAAVRRLELSEYDMSALRKIKAERHCRPFIDGRSRRRKPSATRAALSKGGE